MVLLNHRCGPRRGCLRECRAGVLDRIRFDDAGKQFGNARVPLTVLFPLPFFEQCAARDFGAVIEAFEGIAYINAALGHGPVVESVHVKPVRACGLPVLGANVGSRHGARDWGTTAA